MENPVDNGSHPVANPTKVTVIAGKTGNEAVEANFINNYVHSELIQVTSAFSSNYICEFFSICRIYNYSYMTK